MKTIGKFQLDQWLMHEEVQMPAGAQVLSVANEDGRLCLWAIGDPLAPKVDRMFEAISEGQRVDEGMGVERRFIGTVPMGSHVWHVFERL